MDATITANAVLDEEAVEMSSICFHNPIGHGKGESVDIFYNGELCGYCDRDGVTSLWEVSVNHRGLTGESKGLTGGGQLEGAGE